MTYKVLSVLLFVLAVMTPMGHAAAEDAASCTKLGKTYNATSNTCESPAAPAAASTAGIEFQESAVGNGIDNFPGCEGAAAESPLCQDIKSTSNPLFGESGILTRVANIFATVTGVISVFMMIIGGMKYVNSAGDSTKTATAKNTIMYAAIGIGVAISAGGIVRFILNRL
jgi:Type IV secretion system pilin